MPASGRTRALLRCAVLTLALGLAAAPAAQARERAGRASPSCRRAARTTRSRCSTASTRARRWRSGSSARRRGSSRLSRWSSTCRPDRARRAPSTSRSRRRTSSSCAAVTAAASSSAGARCSSARRRRLRRSSPGCSPAGSRAGGAYAGVAGRNGVEPVVAADREGDVAAVSLGTAATLAARARALLAQHRSSSSACRPPTRATRRSTGCCATATRRIC